MISDWINELLSEDYVPLNLKWSSRNYCFYSNQKECLIDNGVEVFNLNDFLSFIKSSPRFNMFKRYLSNIKRGFIYKSECHGITHNERTALFSFYLSEKLRLTDDDLKIALYGAFYHDIGRHNDLTDDLHGLKSAEKMHKLKLDLNGEDFAILKTIVTAHSIDDENFYAVARKYGVVDYERCEALFKILKDSDGLDRVRLSYPVVIPHMLRNDESKDIIPVSYELYENFKEIKCCLEQEKRESDN